ncbi:ThiF family adenylyltransferase [Pelobium manganitolerans]|uniref:ThiF family adenylyltransferase n=1 Tax=Pelobium manganitolerans TaxID=1842495 RepID=UPI003FA3667D
MINFLNILAAASEDEGQLYKPLFFNLKNAEEKQALQQLIEKEQRLFVRDGIYSQLEEWVKCQHPSKKLTKDELASLIENHLKGTALQDYGVWVYYPWNKNLVHLLGEDEFVEVRTNRNRNKITKEEQATLQSKIIGVAGLSVGQSIALTLAMERVCGEIRIADFDTAELSNLNRIRTGVHNLGLRKTIIAAREIAEIDPFINVKIYSDGLTQQSMDSFFTDGGKLDLFVEVCDAIDVKIDARFKARDLHIPVVMDTNDRGMLDVERFDLDPQRSVFHGYLDGFLVDGKITVNADNRSGILMSILSFESLSKRMQLSMAQIGKSINTWPQLASSVVLGGAITTDICRRILLGEHSTSGRYYVDLDEIFNVE